MKTRFKLTSSTAGMAFALMAGAALAGEEPYVAVVGDDQGILRPPATAQAYANLGIVPGSLQDFYLEPKLYQDGFTHPDTYFAWVDVNGVLQQEVFRADNALLPASRIDSEPCDNQFDDETPLVNRNVRAGAGAPSDWFEWDIVVPKDPIGSLNIVLQCGVLKPDEVYVVAPNPSDNCAGETGEIVKPSCTRKIPGTGKYIKNAALPTLTASAHPGEFNSFTPFNLTAIRNPSAYGIPAGQASNNKNLQVLDGSTSTRIVLKACMPKSILVKLPIEDYLNAAGQAEASLVAGDVIRVRLDVPSKNTVQVYCNAYSAKVMGIGDPISLIDNTFTTPQPGLVGN